MLRALVLAFNQLSDPASRRIVWIGVLSALTAFVALFVAVEWLLTSTVLVTWSWVDWTIDVLGGVAVLALAWILFPAVVVTVSSFLADAVVERVERRHYPHLPPAPSPGFTVELGTAVRFFLVLIAVNLVALPLYIAAPGLNLVIYYVVNGYLVGREYFELVAIRRIGRQGARNLRRERSLRLFSAGVIIAFLSTVPVLNLLVPVIASAFMVHVFQAMKGPLRPAG